MTCKGAIFDLDGVITATATVHFRAWKRTFEEFLRNKEAQGEAAFREFTHEADYVPYVDGKPRYQGVKSFLESRDIELPYGDPSDPPDADTVCGLGNRKYGRFRELIHEEGVDLYDSTVDFVRSLLERGVKVGVASSSKSCGYILKETGLDELFGSVVDGVVSAELGLSGKPNPDIFVVAAERLGVEPYDCMMVEDAYSGVEAGRNGNFGLVLGVARTVAPEGLMARGADIVVSDMHEFSLEELDRWFSTTMHEDAWSLRYHGFEPTEERLREALTTVGNGYFGTRGAYEGEGIKGNIHYPGTYVAGLFNRIPSEVHGKTIYNNDFVNCPNWLSIELRVDNDDFIRPLDTDVLEYTHTLDMRNAIMSREITFRDASGRITTISSRRIASLDQVHLGAIEYRITARNYSGTVTLRSSIDGTVRNYGVERYRDLSSKHLEALDSGDQDAGGGESQIFLHTRTNGSDVRICMNSRSRFFAGEQEVRPTRQLFSEPGLVTEVFTVDVQQERPLIYEKTVSLYTSADWDSRRPERESRELLRDLPRFEQLLGHHIDAWSRLWNRVDIVIEGDRFAQKAIRLHAYHLLVTANPHSTFVDNGLPARGLHGEAYRGHIFWDELFISPFYNLHFPEVTRSHLMYRYRRLDAARAIAREEDFEGALYPWQAADDGTRDSQTLHYNPQSGEWGPDLTYLQRHINVAIAYDIWEYFYTTDDSEFVNEYGMEMLLEMARFWAGIARIDDADGRYHIRKVVGPDEFHEKYPGASEGGIDDNAYTNIMAAWLLHKTIETYHHRPKPVKQRLREQVGFDESELERWDDIVHKMYVPIREDGIIEQFSGWMELEEIDWKEYRRRYGNIRRMDRILKAEGTSPNRYKVIKQADVLQCFYMLAPAQVTNILELMGYQPGDPTELLRRNYEYYIEHTSHGSTLSYVVHSSISNYLESHRQDKWNWFLEALKSDIHDTQGGTTLEGIHCGVMAGTIEILFKGFAGIHLFKDKIELNPQLPQSWRRLSFKITHRANTLVLEILPDRVYARRLIDGQEQEMGCTADGKCYSIGLLESGSSP